VGEGKCLERDVLRVLKILSVGKMEEDQ